MVYGRKGTNFPRTNQTFITLFSQVFLPHRINLRIFALIFMLRHG